MKPELNVSTADFVNPQLSLDKVIASTTLFGKEKTVVIIHDGERYVLRITKLKKLILTK
ncbi:hemin uptake protein HemP [Polynucleobacter bastaniensis]|uniref:hemin uptake protein HemP n=1 Tax=Polynucleobacter bastaniensis TaxID=2081039 RepID=UPI001C0B7C13|nr:hemin uptake protein HemP [Polynucleobacter bastaniensis]MBU3597498.1 hemin uptake protein HemP [Polynucleobacter bastaniensis]